MNPPTRETFSRIQKILLDAEDVDSQGRAAEALSGFKVHIICGPECRNSPQHQIALLTLANLGSRALPGGVTIDGIGSNTELVSAMVPERTLAEAIGRMPRVSFGPALDDRPHIHLGTTKPLSNDISLRCTFGNWNSVVAPIEDDVRLIEDGSCALTPILAAALSISEVFQAHRVRANHRFANVEAGYRVQGFSLWDPAVLQGWDSIVGPDLRDLVLPDGFWLLGLGHLGQAYAWGLAAMPFQDRSKVKLTLNDFDIATFSNVETSALTYEMNVDTKKARFIAAYLDSLGFDTTIVERPFDNAFLRADQDPEVLLCGVDNLETRRHIDTHGFPLVVDAGLGGEHSDYLQMSVRRFPSPISALNAYRPSSETVNGNELLRLPGYMNLAKTVDQCGLERIAGASVGVPFVGAVASSIVLAWALRQFVDAGTTHHLNASLDNLMLRRSTCV